VNEKGLFINGNGIQNTGWKEEPGKELFSNDNAKKMLEQLQR